MLIFKPLLIALSLAIDVFAVSIGIGIRQGDPWARLRFAVAFVCAELTMTLVGAGAGSIMHRLLGEVAGYLGFIALIFVGLIVIVQARKGEKEHLDLSRGWGLVLSAVAVSMDSLGIGFSILFLNVSFALTIAMIACATIAATIFGFMLGKKLGAAVEQKAEVAAGVLLMMTGLLFMLLKLSHHG